METKSVSPAPSVRLFKSKILEKVTYSSPWVTAGIWIPICLISLIVAGDGAPVAWHAIVVASLAIACWGATEYATHRWIYHGRYWGDFGKALRFTMHGCHHVDPDDPRRNMTPIVVALPVGALVMLLSLSLLGVTYGLIFFAQYAFCYMLFDMMHYACHQYHGKSGVMRFFQARHAVHHRNSKANFAVLFVAIDSIIGTRGTE